MLLVINKNGEVLDFRQERVFQGSKNIVGLYLYIVDIPNGTGEFNDVEIVFRLPDNTVLTQNMFYPDDKMTFSGTYLYPEQVAPFPPEGSAFLFNFLPNLTEQWGYHKFSIYANRFSNSQIIATPIVSYYVEESVDLAGGS
jgi:hypothetical protein